MVYGKVTESGKHDMDTVAVLDPAEFCSVYKPNGDSPGFKIAVKPPIGSMTVFPTVPNSEVPSETKSLSSTLPLMMQFPPKGV